MIKGSYFGLLHNGGTVGYAIMKIDTNMYKYYSGTCTAKLSNLGWNNITDTPICDVEYELDEQNNIISICEI